MIAQKLASLEALRKNADDQLEDLALKHYRLHFALSHKKNDEFSKGLPGLILECIDLCNAVHTISKNAPESFYKSKATSSQLLRLYEQYSHLRSVLSAVNKRDELLALSKFKHENVLQSRLTDADKSAIAALSLLEIPKLTDDCLRSGEFDQVIELLEHSISTLFGYIRYVSFSLAEESLLAGSDTRVNEILNSTESVGKMLLALCRDVLHSAAELREQTIQELERRPPLPVVMKKIAILRKLHLQRMSTLQESYSFRFNSVLPDENGKLQSYFSSPSSLHFFPKKSLADLWSKQNYFDVKYCNLLTSLREYETTQVEKQHVLPLLHLQHGSLSELSGQVSAILNSSKGGSTPILDLPDASSKALPAPGSIDLSALNSFANATQYLNIEFTGLVSHAILHETDKHDLLSVWRSMQFGTRRLYRVGQANELDAIALLEGKIYQILSSELNQFVHSLYTGIGPGLIEIFNGIKSICPAYLAPHIAEILFDILESGIECINPPNSQIEGIGVLLDELESMMELQIVQ